MEERKNASPYSPVGRECDLKIGVADSNDFEKESL